MTFEVYIIVFFKIWYISKLVVWLSLSKINEFKDVEEILREYSCIPRAVDKN